MKVEVKETGTWKRALNIEIPADEVLTEMKEVVRDFRRKASMPGFRKGKVPQNILEQRFSGHIEEALLERIIPKTYEAALKDVDLDPIGPPEIKDFRYRKGEPLTFVANIELRPAVELPSLDGVKLTKQIYEVDDAAVEQVVEQIRDANPDYVPADREAINSDRLKVSLLDVSRGPDAEPEEVSLVLGSEGLLPEFQKALLGSRVGSKREVLVTYPSDMEDKELAGRTKRFRVEVREVGERKIPTIDDEFAKKLGVESLEDLRSRVRLRLESEDLMRADREVESALVKQLIERRPFEAPDVMVQNLLANLIDDLGVPEDRQQEFRERQRPGAVMAVQRMLLIDAVVKQNSLGVGDDEVETAIREQIEDENQQGRVIAQARKDGRFERFRHEMEERKALDFLLEKAEIEEVRTVRPSGRIHTSS